MRNNFNNNNKNKMLDMILSERARARARDKMVNVQFENVAINKSIEFCFIKNSYIEKLRKIYWATELEMDHEKWRLFRFIKFLFHSLLLFPLSKAAKKTS